MIDDSPDKFDFEDFNVTVDTNLPDHLTEVIPAEIPSSDFAATELVSEPAMDAVSIIEQGSREITQSIEAFIADEEKRK